jgi:hypothetical protein
MKYLLVAAIAIACAPPVAATQAQTAQEILGPPAVVPLTGEQPPARIIVDPPLPGPLSEGKVFIQYRVVNLRIEPVFGEWRHPRAATDCVRSTSPGTTR